MKNRDASIVDKSYDAIEDAIDLARKDPSKTWEDLLRKTPTKQCEEETSENNRKVAASTHRSKSYPVP